MGGDIYSSKKQPSEFKKPTLPSKTVKIEKNLGTLKVFESFSGQSEVNQSDYINELTPDRPFPEMIDAINKDARLDMARETYVQMILGDGIKIKIAKKGTEDLVREWLSGIGFESLLEDGLYSYVGVGNMLFEKAPNNADFIEIPVDTMKSIVRDKKGNIKKYIQYVNDKEIGISADSVIHFKLSNVSKEVWGRGIFHSILADYEDPRTGKTYDSPLIQMKEIENSMAEIFKSYASPLMMFQFDDAGEDFIKEQASALKDAKPGMKIVTDKPFKVETFEVAGNAKFDGYVQHLQRDVIEPGSKFPLQFFNAGFTARAASESTDSVLLRKVRRIQKRLGVEIRDKIIIPYLRTIGKNTRASDIDVLFQTITQVDLQVPDMVTLYRDNGITRSELRQYLVKSTMVDINQEDMENLPPITSVTPTDKLHSNQNQDKTKEYLDDTSESLEDYDSNDWGVEVVEAEYDGKTVKLNKPFRTSGGPKKFGVYVKNDKGNVVIVRFGDPNMEIKRDDPERRKSFRARHKCDEQKDPTTAAYWSCKMWSTKNVSDLT